jgi:RNA recognition motif-containing protein
VSLDDIQFKITLLISCRKPEAPSSTEPHRGFGYVEFEDPEDVKDAIDNMDQAELFGKVIKVNQAKPPKNVNEGLGSKTALWEQVSSPPWGNYEHLSRKGTNIRYRKVGLPRMLLVRKTNWPLREQKLAQKMDQMTRCKV